MVLRVEQLSRSFGPVQACVDVSFEVQRGEVVALLGENGAGKSTLLSVIAGFVTPDAGRVLVDGDPLDTGHPRAAIRAGVGTAFQHFSLSPALTVRENLALARVDVGAAARRLPGRVDLDAPVEALAVPERQQVEFVKARMLARRVLLLDEPTSLLGGTDVDRVLDGIREAARDGVGVVFVTHRLREALAVADRIVVMRRGWVVERLTRGDGGWPVDAERQLLAAMFGDANAEAPSPPAKDISLPGVGKIQVHGRLGTEPVDISLEMGRVLAVAGIAGNGQGALVELLAGAAAERVRIVDGGQASELDGAALRAWVRHHVAVVPDDRQREGGAPAMPVGETLVLRDLVAGRLSTAGMVSRGRLRSRARELIGAWDIRPANPNVPFGTLSGGNAQRVLLARSLDPLPKLLIAVHPTHGLDHHSVEMVRRELRDAASAGTAVVTIEQDLDDALVHADRVAVIHRGRLSHPAPATLVDRAALQAMMVSGWDA